MQVHYSKQGQMFKSQVQSMHKEILQSPWLCELMAFHINLRETKVQSRKAHAFFDGCSLTFKDEKPALTCELLDSIKIDIDLTCSICLKLLSRYTSFKCNREVELAELGHGEFIKDKSASKKIVRSGNKRGRGSNDQGRGKKMSKRMYSSKRDTSCRNVKVNENLSRRKKIL
ncbi:hypothetical protein HN51_070835 [Arachis hypogaea]